MPSKDAIDDLTKEAETYSVADWEKTLESWPYPRLIFATSLYNMSVPDREKLVKDLTKLIESDSAVFNSSLVRFVSLSVFLSEETIDRIRKALENLRDATSQTWVIPETPEEALRVFYESLS